MFAARGVEIVDGPRKLKERHLKMALQQDGRIFRAIAWRAAERHDYLAEHKAALDVAFSLEQNQYNGETYVELTLADLRQSESEDLVRCRAFRPAETAAEGRTTMSASYDAEVAEDDAVGDGAWSRSSSRSWLPSLKKRVTPQVQHR